MEKKEQIQVYRTKEGTLFEVAFVILAVVVWVLVLWMLSQAPDRIATHFDGSGQPNGWGSPWGLLVPCVITTVVGILLLICAYHPHLINMPVEIKSPRQYELAIRSTRIAALVLLLLTLAIPSSLLLFDSPTPWLVIGAVGLMIAVAIYYSVRIYRSK